MRLSVVIVTIAIATLGVCKADIHSWGRRTEYYDHHMYKRTLIDESNSVPKDYTILYQYYGAHFKPVAYIEINVNAESDGYIHMQQGTQESYFKKMEDRQTFNAQVHIKNALNVTATLYIRGAGMLAMPNMGTDRLSTTKSITYVHVRTANPSSRRARNQFAQNAIGKRREGDQLLHFESRNVMNNTRFPSRAFEYSGGEYITYVGFSFDSPTAMVMVNTTFVDEQQFNAVVYDVNSEHFVANMSVYGIKSVFRPDKFLGVI